MMIPLNPICYDVMSMLRRYEGDEMICIAVGDLVIKMGGFESQ